jgi:hypothetical protein
VFLPHDPDETAEEGEPIYGGVRGEETGRSRGKRRLRSYVVLIRPYGVVRTNKPWLWGYQLISDTTVQSTGLTGLLRACIYVTTFVAACDVRLTYSPSTQRPVYPSRSPIDAEGRQVSIRTYT